MKKLYGGIVLENKEVDNRELYIIPQDNDDEELSYYSKFIALEFYNASTLGFYDEKIISSVCTDLTTIKLMFPHYNIKTKEICARYIEMEAEKFSKQILPNTETIYSLIGKNKEFKIELINISNIISDEIYKHTEYSVGSEIIASTFYDKYIYKHKISFEQFDLITSLLLSKVAELNPKQEIYKFKNIKFKDDASLKQGFNNTYNKEEESDTLDLNKMILSEEIKNDLLTMPRIKFVKKYAMKGAGTSKINESNIAYANKLPLSEDTKKCAAECKKLKSSKELIAEAKKLNGEKTVKEMVEILGIPETNIRKYISRHNVPYKRVKKNQNCGEKSNKTKQKNDKNKNIAMTKCDVGKLDSDMTECYDYTGYRFQPLHIDKSFVYEFIENFCQSTNNIIDSINIKELKKKFKKYCDNLDILVDEGIFMEEFKERFKTNAKHDSFVFVKFRK